MAEALLTSFWIKTPYLTGPLGFGVTAYSLDDAVSIIRGWGFKLPDDLKLLTIREGITVADLDQPHVVSNMGPIVIRGLWYPFAGLGVPKWMDL
jgi:hypothetical protein